MPELPEVEITRRQMAPLLVGRTIRRVETTKPSYFFLTRPALLRERLLGRKVTALDRIGKYLVAKLDDDSRLLLHLGMTGQLFGSGVTSLRLLSASRRGSLSPEAQPAFKPDPHTHLQLYFADRGPVVLFRDVRKFGKCAHLPAGKTDKRLDKLGVDALAARGEDLFEAARVRKIPIKTLLLDQGVLAGVGNIYADEALFLAKVSPKRSAKRVGLDECKAIIKAVKRVMRRSIATGGSSISDYIQPDGRDGGYQNERRVYAREGEPCRVCRTPILRTVLGGRSTHFCPKCQT